MKKVLFSTMLIAGFATASFAQDALSTTEEATTARVQTGSSPDEMAKVITERVHAIVNLSPDQYTKVLEIAKTAVGEQNTGMTAASSSLSATRTTANDDAAGVAVRPLTDRLEKIKAVLTKEQVKKLEAASAGDGTASQQRMSIATPIKKSVSE